MFYREVSDPSELIFVVIVVVYSTEKKEVKEMWQTVYFQDIVNNKK